MRPGLGSLVFALLVAAAPAAWAQPVGIVGRLEGREGTARAISEARAHLAADREAEAIAALREAVDLSESTSAAALYQLARALEAQYDRELDRTKAARLDAEVTAKLRAAVDLSNDPSFPDNPTWAARAHERLDVRATYRPLPRAVRADGRKLAKGDRGPAVRELQALLGVGVDGDFGNITKGAVSAWQRSLGLAATGEVDPATLDAIEDPISTLPSARSGFDAWDRGRNLGPIQVVEIDDELIAVDTARAFLRMRAHALRDGVSIRIVSGFRSYSHQRRLYQLWRAGRGNLAAKPGYSNHQDGAALDLNTEGRGVLRWLNRNGARYGFRRTVPSEPWHWEHRG